jgi:hypothetical protein
MRKRWLTAAGAVLATGAVAAAASATGRLVVGPVTHTAQPTYVGFYDGHKDTYLITDVSNKAQAAMFHANYSAEIGKVKGAPDQYFVLGRAAKGQLSVFGSEPGEANYNPLWDEVFVTWKAGETPVLLVKDDQIDSLVKAGKLIKNEPHIVLNAPITKVGKGG